MLQALADFLARPMHREDGCLLAQEYLQMAALRGFKRASLLFQPTFELGAGHALRIQQICCTVNNLMNGPPTRLLEWPACNRYWADASGTLTVVASFSGPLLRRTPERQLPRLAVPVRSLALGTTHGSAGRAPDPFMPATEAPANHALRNRHLSLTIAYFYLDCRHLLCENTYMRSRSASATCPNCNTLLERVAVEYDEDGGTSAGGVRSDPNDGPR